MLSWRDHRVDDVGGAQELALQRPAVHLQPHGLQQIALRHRLDGARDFGCRPEQIIDQRVDRFLHAGPGAAAASHLDALPRAAFAADMLTDAVELLRHPLIGGDDHH